MSPQNVFQLVILSLGVKSFTLFIYLSYYGDLLSSKMFSNFITEYDYIIVGSGTAGSLIAHRLATETNYSFIVIEAGGRSNPLFEIPVMGPMLHHSVYDWNYETVPQNHACLAMKNKKCRLPQGKIIGGSSKLNNMVHVRGNISHYKRWFHGKHSKIYLKSHFDYIENNILHLDDVQYESELAAAILEASRELGYKPLDAEFNASFRRSKLSQKKGKRWTISDKLDISKHILSNTLVENIVIHEDIAKGVNIVINDIKYSIYAKMGVIISAGTYNSPKILQLSGVGPADVLNSLNIPIVKKLPVGQNLQDHITTGLDLILFNTTLSISPMNMLNPLHVLNYFLNGKGPLTTPGCEVIGFLSTKQDEIQDLQFMVMPVGISADKGSYLYVALGINDTVWANYFSNIFDQHAATILPIILHPKSIGEVYITSKDPYIPPSINPKYLSHEEDVKTLVKGLKLIQKFVETKSMKNLGAFLNPLHFPGCEGYDIFSDIYWECYVRHLTLTSYHPVGTCSMGVTAVNSVVDTNFQVFGIENLYVVDASVMPTLPSGNINAAVAMLSSIFFEENINNLRDKNYICDKLDYLLYKDYSQVCTI